MITREADYATRAVLCLATKYAAKEQMSTLALAEEMDIPYRFLRKIIKTLVEADIVVSKRGKGGGLFLARKPKEISLRDVIEAVDVRGLALSYCLQEGNVCNRQPICKINRELTEVQKMVDEKLSAITLDKMLS